MALERAEIVLPARGRFDLRATVLSNGWHQVPPYRWHDGRRPVLERAEELADGSVHLLRLRPAPRGVVLQVSGEDAREIEVLAPLAARVRRALNLDLDPAVFQRASTGDPLLGHVRSLGLGRLLRGTSLFEDLVKVLAVGNTTWPNSVEAAARLGALGPRCPALPAMRAFPGPAALARLGIRRLRERTNLGDRARSVIAAARDVVRGRHDLRAIEHLSGMEASRRLRKIRGLGSLGVARLLLLLGHHDHPVRDPAARAFARRVLGGDGAPLERWLRGQRPCRGLALWFAQWSETPTAAGPARLRTLRRQRRPGCRAARS